MVTSTLLKLLLFSFTHRDRDRERDRNTDRDRGLGRGIRQRKRQGKVRNPEKKGRKRKKGKLKKLNPTEFQLFMRFFPSPPKRIKLACSFLAFLANFQLEQCSRFMKAKQNKTSDGLGGRNALKPVH